MRLGLERQVEQRRLTTLIHGSDGSVGGPHIERENYCEVILRNTSSVVQMWTTYYRGVEQGKGEDRGGRHSRG